MKKHLILFFALCLPFSLAAQESPPAAKATKPAAPTRVFPTTPAAKPNGDKWRIGYYESGDYEEYPLVLQATAEGLQKLGWIKLPPIPEGLSGEALWRFLAKNAQSGTLEFVGDAYWKPGNFDETLRVKTRQSFMERMEKRHDLDLVIAMGTWAGQSMARLGAPIPVIVASTSDPLGSGIIKSAEDSGLDNLHARVYPGRYQNQVRIFHDIIPFKKLGIVYEDTPEGRSYAAMDAVEEVAKERKFTLVSCHAPFSGVEVSEATAKALACYQKIASQVDAVYVVTHRGVTPASIHQVADILRKAQTPSFSMLGLEEVKAGILMSLPEADKASTGLFHAETVARVFNGAKPRQLTQIGADPAKIALNLETTRQIGFDPPMDILLAADEVYETQAGKK
jgi:ABC-type uncharacterized transport system substrate-binding protein